MTKITTLFNAKEYEYTSNMSIFVSPVGAPKPKTKNIRHISLLFAGVLVVLATLQLFSFEEFPARLIGAGVLPEMASLLATLIVSAEVMALPFALRIPLSPAFRVLSMVSGWLAALKLLAVAVMENVSVSGGEDAVFGATLPLPVGMWSIGAMLALLVLAAWTSWGMWPLRAKK